MAKQKRNKANNWNSKKQSRTFHTHASSFAWKSQGEFFSFPSRNKTKQKALLLYWLLSLSHVTSSPSRDSPYSSGHGAWMERWKGLRKIGRPSQKKKTIKCGGGGIFGSFRTQRQNEKQNNFAQQLMKLIRRRDPLVQITIRPSQDYNCWTPSNNKKLERITLVLLLNQYSRLIYIFPIWLVQNRKRACLWTRRS